MGIAYTGPNTVNLRKDLGPRANTVATLHHGERLEVLETRRRFVKVRTSQGVEGWTDGNYLLTQQQVSDLDALAEFAAKLPSQGAGSVYDTLNVHTAPSRQAPSITQIPEGGMMEVLAHRVTPRNGTMPPASAPAKEPASSKEIASTEETKQGNEPPPPAAPVPSDDWYLIRMKDARTGEERAGWVLARQVWMAIPDEVAQYAEGHVVTAYLPLGKAGATDKNNWLWTTTSSKSEPYDFDSFRVFVWSTKRSRYETAYIERNVKGWYPIEPQNVPGEEGRAFSLVLQDKDGKVYKKTFAFSGYRVKLVSKTPYLGAPAVPEVRTTRNFEDTQAPRKTSWADKLRGLRKRWFGR